MLVYYSSLPLLKLKSFENIFSNRIKINVKKLNLLVGMAIGTEGNNKGTHLICDKSPMEMAKGNVHKNQW